MHEMKERKKIRCMSVKLRETITVMNGMKLLNTCSEVNL